MQEKVDLAVHLVKALFDFIQAVLELNKLPDNLVQQRRRLELCVKAGPIHRRVGESS